jgi:hypothetical protein
MWADTISEIEILFAGIICEITCVLKIAKRDHLLEFGTIRNIVPSKRVVYEMHDGVQYFAVSQSLPP